MPTQQLNETQREHAKHFPERIYICDGGGTEVEKIDPSDMDITDMSGVEDHLAQWPKEAVGVYQLVGFAYVASPRIAITPIPAVRTGRPKGSKNKPKAKP